MVFGYINLNSSVHVQSRCKLKQTLLLYRGNQSFALQKLHKCFKFGEVHLELIVKDHILKNVIRRRVFYRAHTILIAIWPKNLYAYEPYQIPPYNIITLNKTAAF